MLAGKGFLYLCDLQQFDSAGRQADLPGAFAA
jgi:hypothetical protein